MTLTGSLLPAILRTMGILTYSPELGAAVDAATAGVELPAGPHELALRAAAVTAVDTLARASAAAGHLVSASQLSCFLLAQAESGASVREGCTASDTHRGGVLMGGVVTESRAGADLQAGGNEPTTQSPGAACSFSSSETPCWAAADDTHGTGLG